MKLTEIFAKYNRTDLLAGKVGELSRDTYRAYINLWLSWYRGNVRKFHYYKVYNGVKHVTQRRRSAGMAKTVCEDWASLLLNEKTTIVIDDEATQAVVDDVLTRSKFRTKGNQGVEKAFALGLGAFITRVDNLTVNKETGEVVNDGKAAVRVEFVSGTRCYPFTVDDEDITECGFVTKHGKKVYISMHLLGDDGNYEIHNLVGTENTSGSIDIDETAGYVFKTKSPRKWFQIIRPNVANNIAPDSPLGISIYANAIDQLETTDIVFDTFGVEYQYGRKRVYASAEAMTISGDGDTRATFDENDIVFYQFPKGAAIGSDDKPYVQESTGELRAEAFVSGMNEALNFLSTRVGLGENRYKYDASGITTATQVISENSAMFRNVKKHEIIIDAALRGLVDTIIYAASTFAGATVKQDATVKVQFDDSIIEDKTAERERDRQDVAAGLMAKWEYRVKWYGETEEQAKKWEADQKAARPSLEDEFALRFGAGG